MRLEPFPLGAESVRCVWWGELGKGKTLGAVRQVVLLAARLLRFRRGFVHTLTLWESSRKA
jgi:hypothetical protein